MFICGVVYHDVCDMPSVAFAVVNLCVLVCVCEGEESLYLRVTVDVTNLL